MYKMANNSSMEIVDKIKEYTAKYKNPSNSDDISKQICNCKTIGDVKNLVDKTFPTWFVTILPEYSTDYSILQKNWVKVCKKIGCPLAQIMIVEEIEDGPEYTLIREFTECFAAAGFSVRKQMEYIPCSECSRALPSQAMYNYMKENDIPVTDQWITECTTC